MDMLFGIKEWTEMQKCSYFYRLNATHMKTVMGDRMIQERRYFGEGGMTDPQRTYFSLPVAQN
jgi:hypothetical protein